MGNSTISRRDFVGDTLIGAGAALLGAVRPLRAAAGQSTTAASKAVADNAAAAFDGPSGIGDYACANGNTWSVVTAAHRIRDVKMTSAMLESAQDTDEDYDVVVVGGGAAGLGAAQRLWESHGAHSRCLLLDNHAVPGGEAKQNEFRVAGERLIAPQGSNALFAPASAPAADDADDFMFSILKRIGFPLDYNYAVLHGTKKNLKFDISNYLYMWDRDHSDSLGIYFDDDVLGRERGWIRNPWGTGLPVRHMSQHLRHELLRWRHGLVLDRPKEGLDQWLDSMTYRQLLVGVHKLPVEISDFTEPLVASGTGLGSSVVSAYCATQRLGMPGASRVGDTQEVGDMDDTVYFGGRVRAQCFPGGNSGVARVFLKAICPEAIEGPSDIGSIVTRPIAFDKLDVKDAPMRIRVSATVVDVHHTRNRRGRPTVRITYFRGGRLYRVTASRVVMACGGWVCKHIVRDLPTDLRAAYERQHYSTIVSANVALKNWKFLERLGITACLYTGGEFGFSCNIRRPMHIGSYQPPLDPSRPIVLTFYAPFVMPGLDVATQSRACRAQVFATPFREFERRIRAQMTRLFGNAGFDAARDIAGIIINRWGHAYVVPEPGFFIGRPGQPTPGDVVRRGFGQISFGAAETRGYQNFRGGVYEGRRAMEQALA